MTFRGQDIKGGDIGVDLSPNKMKTSVTNRSVSTTGIYHLPFTCFKWLCCYVSRTGMHIPSNDGIRPTVIDKI